MQQVFWRFANQLSIVDHLINSVEVLFNLIEIIECFSCFSLFFFLSMGLLHCLFFIIIDGLPSSRELCYTLNQCALEFRKSNTGEIKSNHSKSINNVFACPKAAARDERNDGRLKRNISMFILSISTEWYTGQHTCANHFIRVISLFKVIVGCSFRFSCSLHVMKTNCVLIFGTKGFLWTSDSGHLKHFRLTRWWANDVRLIGMKGVVE